MYEFRTSTLFSRIFFPRRKLRTIDGFMQKTKTVENNFSKIYPHIWVNKRAGQHRVREIFLFHGSRYEATVFYTIAVSRTELHLENLYFWHFSDTNPLLLLSVSLRSLFNPSTTIMRNIYRRRYSRVLSII